MLPTVDRLLNGGVMSGEGPIGIAAEPLRFPVTFFRNFSAKTKHEEQLTIGEMAEFIRTTSASCRTDLPWWKTAIFGSLPNPASKSGCLRWNGNVKWLSGVVGDYDGEQMMPEEAADRLDKAGVIGLIYTSPSHRDAAPRWRVCCPFSKSLTPDRHHQMVARMNGILGGVLASESFTLSQSYFFGAIKGNPPPRVITIDGMATIDCCDDLDLTAIGKPNGHGRADHKPGKPEAAIEDIVAALAGIPNPIPSWDLKQGTWNEWNTIGMAIWRASGGSDEGRQLFHSWSKKWSEKYDCDETDFRWNHFFDSPPNQIGFGSLVYLAREAVPGWTPPSRRKWAEPDRAVDPQTDFEQKLDKFCRNGDLDSACALFDTKYAVVNEAGKAVVYERTADHLRNREVLVRISYEDLKKFYQNRKITIKPRAARQGNRQSKEIIRSAAEFWLSHRERRSYLGGVVFDPTNKAPASYWNLWTGFAVNPAPGDWSLMQDHLLRVCCGGENRDVEYLLDLAARMYQQPHLPGEVVTVLRGPEGSGKGIFLRYLVHGFGQHGLQITNAQHLVGNFNGHLRDLVALFADEAFYAANPQHVRVLKGLISEPTIAIEDKYRTVVQVPNMLHIWMASDADWVVPMSLRDRRFFVRDVADNRVGQLAYFKAIADQMENGGLAAMIWDLLRRDISGFSFRAIPRTAAMKAQQTLSLGSDARWWLAVLQRGFVWKTRHGTPWFTEWSEDGFYTTELLWRSYTQWCEEARPYDRKTREQLGIFFRAIYQPARPRLEHPVFEIDSIDRRDLDGIPDAVKGGWLKEPKSLDEVAMVEKENQPGYRVGDLDEARDRFLDQYDVDNPWSAAHSP